MHEGFVSVIDCADTRALGIAGTRGRARGIRVGGELPAMTSYTPTGSDPKAWPLQVRCAWLRNTCTCWPASGRRCDQCRDI